MERIRMVGDFELVYEKDMNMCRIMKKSTEQFGPWLTSEDAEKIKEMDDDKFFETAGRSIENSGEIS